MTNEYKENLLNYLTGNIEQESQSTTPFYNRLSTTPYAYNPTDIGLNALTCKDGKGEPNGLDLYYSASKIGLVDSKDMRIIKSFTAFSSGTSFGRILDLQVDEVGNVYGLDVIQVNGVDTYRVILLNNISEIPKGYNDYQVILRNSYYVQGYSEGEIEGNYSSFIRKSTQSATYYIGFQNMVADIMPTIFQINVGSANTWTRLPSHNFSTNHIDVANIYFDTEDRPVAEFIATVYKSATSHDIKKSTSIGDSVPEQSIIIADVEKNYYYDPISDIGKNLIELHQNYYDNFFFSIRGVVPSGNAYTAKLVIYNYNDGVITKVGEYYSPTGNYSDISPHEPRGRVMNDLYLFVTPQYIQPSQYNICISMVGVGVKENYFIETDVVGAWSAITSKRYGVYNLYNQYIINYINSLSSPSNRTLVSYQIIYNSDNYNGEAYDGINALVPNQGLLFGENNSLIFARNLYNKKVYNNQTISTINVPNNLLNDISIENQSLYGVTNVELVTNAKSVVKNNYENLYINFVNAISMQNQNTDEYSYNLPGSSRLNTSSSKDLDYERAKASKIRVSYSDGTEYISRATNEINNGVCTYTIYLYVPVGENIQKIEIISEDEITTYQTISNLNLENNKYYVITQDVHVE